MSDSARRVVVYRNWLDYLESLPASAWRDREIFISDSKLRDYADFVLQWGC